MQQALFYSHSIRRDARGGTARETFSAFQGSAALWRVGVLTPSGELDTLSGVESLELSVVSYGGATPGSVNWIHKVIESGEFTTPTNAESVLSESEWNAEFSLTSTDMRLPVTDDGERYYWYEIRANLNDGFISILSAGVIVIKGTSQTTGNAATTTELQTERSERMGADSTLAAALADAQRDIAALQYIPIQITSLRNNAAGSAAETSTVEVGSTVVNLTLTWATNTPPDSLSFNNGIGEVSPPSLTSITAPVNLSSSAAASFVYTLTATDGTDYDGNTATRSTTVNFRHRAYWGVTAKAPGEALTSADILALDDSGNGGGSAFGTARQRTFTADADPSGEYVVYAIPEEWEGTGMSFIISGLENNNWERVPISLLNGSGWTSGYIYFRLRDKQFDSGITVQVL